MVSDPCAPQGDCCQLLRKEVECLSSQVTILKTQVEGYLARLCTVEGRAVANVEILEGGVIRLTNLNGSFSDATSPYLVQLLQLVNDAINDTSEITGGEINASGDLVLFRQNGTPVTLGNIISTANPVRDIEIRNDGRIQLTLADGTTTITTDETIQSAVTIPSGGSTGVGLSLLTTPVEIANSAVIGDSGSVNVAAAPGVTVPVGTTHVILRGIVQHHVVNSTENERQPNWTKLTVETKMIAYAGRRTVGGSEPTATNYDINNSNSALAFIVLPGDNTIDWVSETVVETTTNPAADDKRHVRVTLEVIGFVIGGSTQ